MSMRNRIELRVAIAGILAMAAGASATAQESKAPDTMVLEEIVVTAQKRSENLQDVPVAVSAFSSEVRDIIGIETIRDFTNFTPGVTYSTSLDRMNIRGIGRYTNNLSTSPGVATYGDGFYNYSNHQADTSALFTERVEILRGPQGTLYGRNSIGGAVNVLLKRPSEEMQGEVRAGAGNYGQRRAEALFRGPISDSVGFLIGGGKYEQEDGYVENVVGLDEEGRQEEIFANAQLAFKFGDTADVWLKYAYGKWDNGWGSSVNISPYNTVVGRCTPTPPATSCASLLNSGSLGPSALFNTGTGVAAGVPFALNPASPQYTTANPGVRNHRQVRHDTPQHEELDPDHTVVLETTFHMGGADLKYIGGWHQYEYVLFQDFDNSDRKSYVYTPLTPGAQPVTVFTQVVTRYSEQKDYYSNELNLTSTGDGPFQWILGAYHYNEKYEQPVTVGTADQPQLVAPRLPVAGFPLAAPNPSRSYSSTDAHVDITSVAGFGQIDYKFSDTWKATLGLRYTKDEKSGDEFLRFIRWDPGANGAATPAFDISATVAVQQLVQALGAGANVGVLQPDGHYMRHLETSSNATTGTGGLQWTPSDATMTYLNYSRGYKDAAINSGAFAVLPFSDPEFVNAYEFGLKQQIGGRFQMNTSLFFYDYEGAQIPLTLVRGVGLPNVGQTFNLDEQIYGAEFETLWQVSDAFQMLLNYSYIDPQLTDQGCYSDSLDTVLVGPNLCATGGHSVDGNRVPFQPRNKVALNGTYRFQFTPGSLAVSASWLWRDTQYASIFNRRENLLPAYDQTDLRMTWTGATNSYSVVGYVRNVLDDEGFDGVSANATASGITNSFSLTPPRTFGLELQYRFGK
jgi:iron complex outermembrane receptor protein